MNVVFSRKIVFASIAIVLSAVSFSQNNDFARFMGGVDQIVNYQAFLIGTYLAWTQHVMIVVGAFFVVFKPYSVVVLIKRILFSAILVVSIIFSCLSVYYFSAETFDMIFGSKPIGRLLLNFGTGVWAGLEIYKSWLR